MGLVLAVLIGVITLIGATVIFISIAAADTRGDASVKPVLYTLLIGWGIAGAFAFTHYHPVAW